MNLINMYTICTFKRKDMIIWRGTEIPLITGRGGMSSSVEYLTWLNKKNAFKYKYYL